ncbi:MAG: hypothetical protein VCD66_10550, partial [Alphaproteobacteria bacterium]
MFGLASANDQNFIDLETNLRRRRDQIPFRPIKRRRDPSRLPKPPTATGGKGDQQHGQDAAHGTVPPERNHPATGLSPSHGFGASFVSHESDSALSAIQTTNS